MLPSRIAKFAFIPFAIRKAMYCAASPRNPDEDLFQHIVGRAVMDALGFTGLDKPHDHNTEVRAARAWLKFGDNAEDYFLFARIEKFDLIREKVLATRPFLMKESE